MRTYNGQFLGQNELEALGVRCEGDDVRVHTSVVIVAPECLRLGNHVRVDPFSLLSASGEISLGDHIHIGSHCTLIGGGGISVEDFAGISHGARLFSATDDLGGSCLTGPTVPEQFRNVRCAPIQVRRHAVIGSGAVVLPGVALGEGAILGALSLLRSDLPEWEIWSGIPAHYLRGRRRDVLKLEEQIDRFSPQSGS
jgi:acetyltransferase-like isoleucine patch superfamily enzyme